MTGNPVARPAGTVRAWLKRVVDALRPRTWLAYPLLMMVALSGWVISSPVGSSPDESYHLVSIWCAQGPRPGLCAMGPTNETRLVPLDLTRAPCYAFHSKKSGACPTFPGGVEQTDHGNFVNYYPNGFYLAMSLFIGPSLDVSVIMMRLLNCLLFSGGLAMLLFLTPPPRRANYMLGATVTMVPLGMFSVASINPSSWAVTSATLLWAAAVEFMHATEKRHRYALLALCVGAFAMGASSRADSAAYAGLAVALAWLSTTSFTRRALIQGGIVAAVVVGASIWALSRGSAAGLFVTSPLRPDDIPSGWWQRLQDLPGFYFDTFSRGLGWLDTYMRSGTWALAGAGYFAAIFWGLRRVRWRKAVCLAIVVLVGAAIPLILTTARHTLVAASLQQRYFLPLMIIAAMIALAQDNPDGPELNRAQAWLVVVALAIANANALHTNLRRYITGLDGKWFNLNINVQWWWMWAPPPMIVFGIGAAAFMGAVGVAAITGLKEPDEPDLSTIGARRALV